MSRRTPPPPPSSRRARRAAQRAARQQGREPGLTARLGGLPGSPLIWLTAAAGAIAAVIIGALVLLNSKPTTAAGLASPAVTSPANLAQDRTLGSPQAPVTIDVWADFQCPGCGTFSRVVAPRLVDAYVTQGKVKILYHDFAFLGQESQQAAVAARCAAQQGRFWAYHDYVFANQGGENQGAFSRDRLLAIGDAVGLDRAAFTRCLEDPSVAQAVQAETQQGASSGINSTPTLFLNGQKLPGYEFPTVSAAIDAALGAGSPRPSGASPSASPGS